MPAIFGANTESAAYEISNSLRFNQGDHCLTQNFSGTESSNRKKWTFSVWFKRSNLITSAALFSAGSSGQDEMTIRLEQHKINWQEYKVSNTTMIGELITNQVLKDVAAWYHLVCRWDSTDSTAGDRMKMFLNGVEITSFATDNNPSVNYDSMASNSVLHNVGRQSWNNGADFDGYMADVNFVEGLSLDPSYFGETDSNGIWVPKEPDVSSYGNNGFFLEFQQTGTSQNSSGIGADTSGNDKHFAVSNLAATDQTTDTPTNNFCTMMPLTASSRATFSEGNTKLTLALQGSVPYGQVEFGTFFLNTGKWYYEVKSTTIGGGGQVAFGWNEKYEDGGYYNGHNNLGSSGNAWYGDDGNIKIGTESTQSTGVDAFVDNDIIGCAIDLDNNKVYWHKNGNYQDDPTPSPASNNGRALVSSYNNYWTPWISKDSDNHSHNPTAEFNFGNPSFSISSGNSDGNGYGNFEYAVPSGFYSLCTKNLAEYG